MKTSSKAIIIKDFLKWQRLSNRPETELVYASGFYNMFKYSTILESFLKEQGLAYSITTW